jgi:hypothetical protein
MPATFELTTNPFHILSVSLRTRKDDIAAAHDEALADHLWPEAVLWRAQQALLTPKPRLDAELSWLPTISPTAAKDVLAKLAAGDFESCQQALQNMTGLDRANLAADLCCRNPNGANYVPALVDAYSEFDDAAVAATVTDNRAVSAASRLDSALLGPALAALRRSHAKAAIDNIRAQPSPGLAMLEVVDEFLDSDSDNVRHILGDIAKEYDSWSEPRLRAIRDAMQAEISAIRVNPALQSAIDKIEDLLEKWDAISQPMQVIEQFKGHDEPRSRELYNELRELCLWLANEEGHYEQALAISQALLDTFPELPSVSLDLSKDIETLAGLAAEARTHRRLKPLSDLIERLDGIIKNLARDLVKSGFGPSATGQGKALYAAFEQCVAATAGADDADLPWMLLRHIGLKLNNEVNDSQAALALIDGLQRYPARPSAEIAQKMAEDRKTIRGNILFGELNAAMERGDTGAVMAAIDSLIANGVEDGQRKQLADLRSQVRSRKRAGRIKTFVWLAIVGGIIAAVVYGADSNRPSYAPSTAYTPSTTYPPTTGSGTSSGFENDMAEAMPPMGTDLVLSRSQIRYCLFQESRLEYLRRSTSDSLNHKFNALVDDWNSRCSSYRYREADMNAVRRDLISNAATINLSAQRILDSWKAASPAAAPTATAPSPQTAPTAASAATSDLSTPWGAWRVQAKLQALGFYKGVVDGSWGPGSKAALRAWKKSVGLPDNDAWDRPTEALLME